MDRTPSHETFSRTLSSLCTDHSVAQGVARRVCIKHVHPNVITCLSVCCFFVLYSSSVSRASTFSLTSTCCLFRTSTSMMTRTPSIEPKAHPQNEEYCPVAIYNPLTGYEHNQLDNFDYSEASAALLHDESVDIDTEMSYSCDAELDDELVGKALSSPLFIQEREESAKLRQTYHSHEESLLSAQSFFTRTSTGRPVYEPRSNLSQKNGNQVATWKTSKSGFSLKDKKSKFLLKSDLRSRSTNFKPSLTEEVSRN